MVIGLFAVLTGVLLVLALIFSWSAQGRGLKWLYLGLTLLCVPYAGFVVLAAHSLPKPVEWEWRNLEDARVLAHVVDYGRGLYVVLDVGEPRLFKFPWSEETEKMAKVIKKGDKKTLVYDGKRIETAQLPQLPPK